MFIASIPVLMVIVGILMYALASPQNPKVATIGERMFFAGFIGIAVAFGPQTVTLLSHH
jgi:hypothetical protein